MAPFARPLMGAWRQELGWKHVRWSVPRRGNPDAAKLPLSLFCRPQSGLKEGSSSPQIALKVMRIFGVTAGRSGWAAMMGLVPANP